MEFLKKLNLNRFKRSMQGLVDFAALIEQADPASRDRILDQAGKQDADFLHKVMRKVVYFEEIIYIDQAILAEICQKLTPKILAYALYGFPPEFRETILGVVGFRERKLVTDEEEKFGTQPAISLVLGAQRQILKTARLLESQNKFVFELTTCPRFKTRRLTPPPMVSPSPTLEMPRAVVKK